MTSAQADAVEASPAYGLFPADDFRITSSECADCDTIAQALWFFRKETIAVPRPGFPLAGFDPQLRAKEDVRRWNELTPPGSARDYPGLVWIGSPQVIEHARLDAGACLLYTSRWV